MTTQDKTPAIVLEPGREKSVLQRHPWIFSSAVAGLRNHPEAGETVEVLAADGRWLARAAFSTASNIRARIWTWEQDEEIDKEFFRRRLMRAVETRALYFDPHPLSAYRLVHAESDGLPGFVVDRYADFLVLQCLSAGAERWRDTFSQALLETTGLMDLYERSDVDVRLLEGLKERSGVLHGRQPSSEIEIEENGLRFKVDIRTGQKTGFYLDQRYNRQRLRELANGMKVLNCFCYTGAFSVYALAGGAASVLSIDSSAEALAAAGENMALNGFSSPHIAWQQADVFKALRSLRDRAESFDLIVLDPPKFAPTVSQKERASRGYKDINLLAFKLLRRGGLLFTFSCSGGIAAELFQKIVADAALDAGVEACILERLFQGPDHPTGLNFPEGTYLKGLVCRKL